MLEIDVLIIGSGLAGMMAALSAKERSADVLIISKTDIDKSGATYITRAGFSVVT